MLLENPAEVVRIVEPEFVGYFADALVRFGKQLFYLCHGRELDVFLCGFTRLFLYQVTEIIGRKAYFIGAILYGGQTYCLGLVGVKIFVQQFLKLVQHTAVTHLPGNELAFIETHTMIEQCFYVRCHNLFGVLVNDLFQFITDLMETVEDYRLFPLRHVQRLVAGVREE